MANFSQTHPAMAAKLMDFIEAGLDPEQIIQQFKQADEVTALENEEGGDDDEVFPDEVKIIAQALAYREATMSDVEEIYNLLNSAYKPEMIGSESFRIGECVNLISVAKLLRDPTYKWLIVEAPSGKNIEVDGVILGAACFSTDGVSRCNGVVEGALGSIRFLGVLPRYHGFCVGRRLLERIENIMFQADCCKVMACVPSTRTSAMEWVERRGYSEAGCSPYPAAGLEHTVADAHKDVQLVRFVKLKETVEKEKKDGAASSTVPSGTWHLKNKPITSSLRSNKPAQVALVKVESNSSDEEVDIPGVD